MKKAILLCALALGMSAAAKDIRTLVLTTEPPMHCSSCENKIKGNLRFEKGVKQIDTSVDDQTVTITYDADKTTPDALIKAFPGFGYQARTIEATAEQNRAHCNEKAQCHGESKAQCQGESKAQCQGRQGDQAKAQCQGESKEKAHCQGQQGCCGGQACKKTEKDDK